MKQKIETINSIEGEIENYKGENAGLEKKLSMLIELFDVYKTGNIELVDYVNNYPIETLKYCITELKIVNKSDKWLRDLTLRQVKEHSLASISNFIGAYNYFQHGLLWFTTWVNIPNYYMK